MTIVDQLNDLIELSSPADCNTLSVDSPAQAGAPHEFSDIRTILVRDRCVCLLDQRKLPAEMSYVEIHSADDMSRALADMTVRGAPVMGVAAALGVAVEALRLAVTVNDTAELIGALDEARRKLQATRPTAVNVRWGSDLIYSLAQANAHLDAAALARQLFDAAAAMIDADINVNKRLGSHGGIVLNNARGVMTHCNAGALATCGWGTALGVIRSAYASGWRPTVFVNETRPRQQGARLTAWELLQDGITPVLITDSMAGYVMSKGLIDVVVVGADRIAANGDTANKIGTYTLAIVARAHNVPFYIAAPLSTIDPAIASGSLIPIEERDPLEVKEIAGQLMCPPGVKVFNPAFDVTPSELISGIITEAGILRPPYPDSIALALSHAR